MNVMFNRFRESRNQRLLSAYLDNQLKSADRVHLEARLRQEPELQQAFTALRRTRAMIRSLPVRKAPRNFTLSPAMVGERSRTPARPVFGMVSAVAVLLLVFMLIGDFLVIPEYIGMFPVARIQAEDDVAFEAKSQPQAESETLIFPTSSPTELATLPEEPALAMEQAVEEEAVESEGAEPAEEAAAEEMPEAAVMADAMPEPTPCPEESAQFDESLRAFEAETPTEGEEAMGKVVTETVLLEPTPAEPAGNEVEVEPLLILPEDAEIPVHQTQLWPQVLFWMLEIFLASVAIGSGLVAVYAWVRQRS